MKKFVSVLVVAVFLISLVFSVLKITSVNAQNNPNANNGTIYIESNGSINPSNVPIQREGNTYLMTSDLHITFTAMPYNAIEIQKDDVTLDGGGHRIYANGASIYVNGINGLRVKNFDLTHSGSIILWVSSNDIVQGNKIGNTGEGIVLYRALNNIISNNTFIDSNFPITVKDNSNYNTISDNYISETIPRSSMDHLPCVGVDVEGSSNNIISKNVITQNIDSGIKLESSTNNRITDNKFDGCDTALEVYFSSGNQFFHNDFVNNTVQVLMPESGYTNSWDDGTRGNYWSNYNGTDSNNDGIGDTPFPLCYGNQDRFPVMSPLAEIPEFSLIVVILFVFMAATLWAVVISRVRR